MVAIGTGVVGGFVAPCVFTGLGVGGFLFPMEKSRTPSGGVEGVGKHRC